MCISNNCVYDIDGDGCEEYAGSGTSACTGAWDTADFTATCHCCECGGGINVSNSGDDGTTDENDDGSTDENDDGTTDENDDGTTEDDGNEEDEEVGCGE